MAPQWLVGLTRKKPAPITETGRRAPSPRITASQAPTEPAALEGEIASLPPPCRERAIMRSTGRASACTNWLPAARLDGAEVERRLIEAAIANGLMTDPDDGPR